MPCVCLSQCQFCRVRAGLFDPSSPLPDRRISDDEIPMTCCLEPLDWRTTISRLLLRENSRCPLSTRSTKTADGHLKITFFHHHHQKEYTCAATWDDVDGWWIHDAKLIDFPLRVIEFQISISERDTTTPVSNDDDDGGWLTINELLFSRRLMLSTFSWPVVKWENHFLINHYFFHFFFKMDGARIGLTSWSLCMYTAVIILFVFICFVIVAQVIIGDNWINGLLCRRRK